MTLPTIHLTRTHRRVLRWASQLAFVAVCVVVAGVAVVLLVLPRLTGGAALTVLTGSMTPEIPVGAVVLIRPVDPQTLRVGDVATYQVSPESRALVTHRVVEVIGSGDETRYVFKGDANRGADTEPVPPQAIRGEVWFHVPLLGSLRDAVQGMNLLVMLAPPALAAYAVLLLVGGARDRGRRTPPVPPVDRHLVAARFDHGSAGAIDGTPPDLARSWGGVLLTSDDAGFVVLLTTTSEALDETLLLVRAMDPECLWISEGLDADRWQPLEVSGSETKEAVDATA